MEPVIVRRTLRGCTFAKIAYKETTTTGSQARPAIAEETRLLQHLGIRRARAISARARVAKEAEAEDEAEVEVKPQT